ncbi:MAG: LysR family transcriptional regulator, partial [Myxococcales bacterium]
MEWLNYHHLFYFWTIAREGSLTRAAARLHLTHSTLSTQVKALENFLHVELFERRGRGLVLTPAGTNVVAYADDIFRLGAEMVDVARGSAPTLRTPLRVGVVGAIPKTLAYRLLEPALAVEGFGPLVVRQESLERLLESLAAGRLHVVLSDAAPPEGGLVRVHGHALGSSGVLLYGTPALARTVRKGFPASLQDAPLLLPAAGTSLRRQVERWLTEHGLRVQVEGEFDDAGLMRTFGAQGRGLFLVREALRAEVEDSLGVEMVGRLEGLHEHYYGISVERRVRHPAVSALVEAARLRLAAPEA